MRTAIGLLVCLAPFTALASQYTLADSNGVPSCNLIVLTLKQQLDYGQLFSQKCKPPGPTMGGSGVLTSLPGSPDKVWSFSVTESYTGTALYFFNIKALTWIEYYENGDAPLTLVGSGVLLKGGHAGSQRSPASAAVK